jgi:hypothetical protein
MGHGKRADSPATPPNSRHFPQLGVIPLQRGPGVFDVVDVVEGVALFGPEGEFFNALVVGFGGLVCGVRGWRESVGWYGRSRGRWTS